MPRRGKTHWVTASLLAFALNAVAGGVCYQVEYPASQAPGELKLGVTYVLWLPEGVRELRGVIVHQHGCGAPACQGGATAAHDLHWQALAKKWDCALLGPSYQQAESDNCALWSDPRNGSELTFLKCLAEFAEQSGHPELERVPWCLWGHSGGGYWAAEMQLLHPERVVAVWLRSGASKLFRPDSPDTRVIPPAFYDVPVMCNPGVKEKTDRFARIWEGMLETFRSCRRNGAPIGFAPDPRTSHECGDSRYLAIPFFDACLTMRLPERGGAETKLRPVDFKAAWLAPLLGTNAAPANAYSGAKEEAVWLPNERVALAWVDYVKTGAVGDNSPPSAPHAVRAVRKDPSAVEVTWEVEADLESGLGGFVVERDGQELGKVPEKPAGRFGRPLFQPMSYHDTPERPLPRMTFTDTNAPAGVALTYRVAAINSAGLRSVATSASVAAQSGRLRPGRTKSVFPGAAWEERSPAAAGFNPVALEGAIQFLKEHAGRDGVREMVIVRDGFLIWRGDNIDHVHGVWSCTKSFTSTCLGLLIEDGRCTLDTAAAAHLPALRDAYPGVTLRHFTTMTSGYRARGDEPKGSYTHGPSSTPFEPSPEPLFTPPGSQYAYWDSAMNMFGLVLTRIAGEPLQELFRRRIAEPIGMNPSAWRWGNFGEHGGSLVNGGSGNEGKHVQISAREMARFGLLLLNHGNWNGHQLLSSNWLAAATACQVPASIPLGHLASGIDGRGVYGFNWWVNAVDATGKRLWPNAPPGTFAASGHNNNLTFVIPEWRMVVVRLGLDQADRKISAADWSEFFARLGAAQADSP